uniref:Uncharacterized protein n=1 Tax=Anopheles melas TaxID=34690 RepID=A0A182TVW9_9DIPT
MLEMNFSMNSSESSTAMWAARPISALAVCGSAWCTSNRASVRSCLASIGAMMLCTISLQSTERTQIHKTNVSHHSPILTSPLELYSVPRCGPDSDRNVCSRDSSGRICGRASADRTMIVPSEWATNEMRLGLS